MKKFILLLTAFLFAIPLTTHPKNFRTIMQETMQETGAFIKRTGQWAAQTSAKEAGIGLAAATAIWGSYRMFFASNTEAASENNHEAPTTDIATNKTPREEGGVSTVDEQPKRPKKNKLDIFSPKLNALGKRVDALMKKFEALEQLNHNPGLSEQEVNALIDKKGKIWIKALQTDLKKTLENENLRYVTHSQLTNREAVYKQDRDAAIDTAIATHRKANDQHFTDLLKNYAKKDDLAQDLSEQKQSAEKLEELKQKLAGLEDAAKANHLDKKLSDAIDQLKQEIKEYQQKCDNVHAQADKYYANALHKHETRLDDHEKRFTASTFNQTKLNSDLRQIEKDLATLTKDKANQSTLQEVAKDLKNLQETFDELTRNITEQYTNKTDFQKKYEHATQLLLKVQMDITELQKISPGSFKEAAQDLLTELQNVQLDAVCGINKVAKDISAEAAKVTRGLDDYAERLDKEYEAFFGQMQTHHQVMQMKTLKNGAPNTSNRLTSSSSSAHSSSLTMAVTAALSSSNGVSASSSRSNGNASMKNIYSVTSAASVMAHPFGTTDSNGDSSSSHSSSLPFPRTPTITDPSTNPPHPLVVDGTLPKQIQDSSSALNSSISASSSQNHTNTPNNESGDNQLTHKTTLVIDDGTKPTPNGHSTTDSSSGIDTSSSFGSYRSAPHQSQLPVNTSSIHPSIPVKEVAAQFGGTAKPAEVEQVVKSAKTTPASSPRSLSPKATNPATTTSVATTPAVTTVTSSTPPQQPDATTPVSPDTPTSIPNDLQ